VSIARTDMLDWYSVNCRWSTCDTQLHSLQPGGKAPLAKSSLGHVRSYCRLLAGPLPADASLPAWGSVIFEGFLPYWRDILLPTVHLS
jgi:hypothetical protein